MLNQEAHDEEGAISGLPTIRTIAITDLKEVLAAGFNDFAAHPTHRMFLSLVIPVAGILFIRFAMGAGIWALIPPIFAGFALIGPFLAIGMYGLSRRHETHPAVTWRGAADAFRSASMPSILGLGLVLLIIFITWIQVAELIYQATFAPVAPDNAVDFFNMLFTTGEGRLMMLIGNTVGLIFAIVVLSISVISFPLLIDKHVRFVTAITISVKAVVANPLTMTVWGIIVVGSLVLGALPFFIGLAIVFPVLGHATWHLYRRTIQY